MKTPNFAKIMKKVTDFQEKNAPAILAGVAVVGLIVTAVSAYKAGQKMLDIKAKHIDELNKNKEKPIKEKKETIVKIAKEVAPVMAPTVVLGAASIGCILGSHSASRRRIAALSAAYSISETALKDLEGKMSDILGEKKTREIKDSISKDKLSKGEKPKENQVIITGNGEVLCKDSYSGRFFMSSAEKIGRAINWASNEARVCMYVSLNEFYDQLDIPRIPLGDDLGWNADDLVSGTLPITYTAILTDDNRPCLCVESLASVRQSFRDLY